ncbi:uncharacterized protein LOC111253555 isoform X1 [Varroa destructor]|uniref:Uncharacterized protein n=1 Tax=Varroa destructor TaxID=109461 RepID=A0A7M7KPG5_VARDE|nr:uncharacterized protein LOC111253555 isoform X1 [Varroa destructor]
MWWEVKCWRNLHRPLILTLALLLVQGVVAGRRRPYPDETSVDFDSKQESKKHADEIGPSDLQSRRVPVSDIVQEGSADGTHNARHPKLHTTKRAFASVKKDKFMAETGFSLKLADQSIALKSSRDSATVVSKRNKNLTADAAERSNNHAGVSSLSSSIGSSKHNGSSIRTGTIQLNMPNYDFEDKNIGSLVDLRPKPRSQELARDIVRPYAKDSSSTEGPHENGTKKPRQEVIYLTPTQKVLLYVLLVVFIYTVIVTLFVHLYCLYKCCVSNEDEML